MGCSECYNCLQPPLQSRLVQFSFLLPFVFGTFPTSHFSKDKCSRFSLHVVGMSSVTLIFIKS